MLERGGDGTLLCEKKVISLLELMGASCVVTWLTVKTEDEMERGGRGVCLALMNSLRLEVLKGKRNRGANPVPMNESGPA